MASTQISIVLQGVDRASATIKAVSDRLNGLAAKSGLDKIYGASVNMATGALGRMGNAITSLGPAGVAASALLVGAMRRYKYEVEQAVAAVRDHKQAVEAMASAADAYIASLEKAFDYERRLRQLRNDAEGSDPVTRAITSLDDKDAEIEIVKKEIERLQGVRAVAMRTAVEAAENVDAVGFGHAVWWETGTEAANKENLALAEKSREIAKRADEQLLDLQRRLTLLAKEREVAERGIADAIDKQREAEEKELAKEQERVRKAEMDGLSKRRKELEGQLRAMQSMASQTRLSGLFAAGSHATSLLMGRLEGRNDANDEVARNVRSIVSLMGDIDRRLEQLRTV